MSLLDDRAGNQVVLATNVAGNVLQVTSPDGYTLQFTYDPTNHVLMGAEDPAVFSVSRDIPPHPTHVGS